MQEIIEIKMNFALTKKTLSGVKIKGFFDKRTKLLQFFATLFNKILLLECIFSNLQ